MVRVPEIPKLFNRFYRVQAQQFVAIHGTGLGLFMVKSLEELMAGSVWVESTVGEGSSFFAKLPAAAVVQAAG